MRIPTVEDEYDLWCSHLLFVCVYLTLHSSPEKMVACINPDYPNLFYLARLGWASAEIIRLFRKHMQARVDLKRVAMTMPQAATVVQVGAVHGAGLHGTVFQLGEEVLHRVFRHKKTDRAFELFPERFSRRPEFTLELYARRWLTLCRQSVHMLPDAMTVRKTFAELLVEAYASGKSLLPPTATPQSGDGPQLPLQANAGRQDARKADLPGDLEDVRGYFLSAEAWARRYGVPYGALRRQLERRRQSDPGICILNPDRRKNEPLYLFRGEYVLPIVAELRKDEQHPPSV